MDKDRKFVREYSLNVVRLGLGKHQDSFEINDAFFAHFEQSMVREAKVEALLDIEKFSTHLDVGFHIKGEVRLACDRCGSPYPHTVDQRFRIIYSFDPDMDFEGYEVMHVNNQESHLVLIQELYDFVHLAIPMRKVPPKEVHLCAAEVLKMLGLTEDGDPMEQKESQQETDPRWDALKNLKDKMGG
ncbi:MAG: DUF177 domain-containing protein [Bacteroidota bacterium]